MADTTPLTDQQLNETDVEALLAEVHRLRAELADLDAESTRWANVHNLIEKAIDKGWSSVNRFDLEDALGPAAVNAQADATARLLGCGLCYEENGEEVHPHPECPIGQTVKPTTDSRRERYTVAIHDAMESDLSLVDQEPGCQALFARAAEAAAALADAEQDQLRAELAAEQQQHTYTFQQRNNRSKRLLHLRNLAEAGDLEALRVAALDVLAASAGDHTPPPTTPAQIVAYGDGMGRAYCLACPHPDDLEVLLTIRDLDEPDEQCYRCDRSIVDVAREQTDAAEARLGRLRTACTHLLDNGALSMSAQWVLDVINGTETANQVALPDHTVDEEA